MLRHPLSEVSIDTGIVSTTYSYRLDETYISNTWQPAIGADSGTQTIGLSDLTNLA